MEVETSVPSRTSRRREVPRQPVTISGGPNMAVKVGEGEHTAKSGNFWAKLVYGKTYVLGKQIFTRTTEVEVTPEVKKYLEKNAIETKQVRENLETYGLFEFRPV